LCCSRDLGVLQFCCIKLIKVCCYYQILDLVFIDYHDLFGFLFKVIIDKIYSILAGEIERFYAKLARRKINHKFWTFGSKFWGQNVDFLGSKC